MTNDERWILHLDEGDVMHFAPESWDVCSCDDLPPGSVTIPFPLMEPLRRALNELREQSDRIQDVEQPL